MNKYLDPKFLFKNLVSIETDERVSIPLFQAFIKKMYFKNDKPDIYKYIVHANAFEFYKYKKIIQLSKAYGYKEWILYTKDTYKDSCFYNSVSKKFEMTSILFSVHYFDLIEALEIMDNLKS